MYIITRAAGGLGCSSSRRRKTYRMNNPKNAQDLLDFLLSEEGDPADLQEMDSEVPGVMSEEDSKKNIKDIPPKLPILTLRNTVLFPGVVIPITVARDHSIKLVKEAYRNKEKRFVGVVSQRDAEVEHPNPDDLYEIGTVAAILRLIRMPDGSVTIVIQGRSRFRVEEYVQEEPYFIARASLVNDLEPDEDESAALIMNLKSEAARIIELAPNIPSEANVTLQNIHTLSYLVNFTASNLNISVEEKQEILEESRLNKRSEMVLERLGHELAVLEISEEIQNKVKTDLDKQQRDYILRQQMKSIQEELGEQSLENEIEEFVQRAEEKEWTEEAQAAFDKEVAKLYRINPGSPEYGVALNYLEWMLDLPWGDFTKDRLDLGHARQVLDKEHYGLEKVKERIIEYLAVLKLKEDMKAPILCFYGPPGVGKTSLGKSIAEALNREFVRISLGGVRDEAEIRGHRRTYIGAMPGRILQGLKKAGTGNPVFMLDEVDKVGNDYRGDPSSALLEVLDPEQNDSFSDHYLEVSYDLSPIMFIATANTLDTIHPALRDRMEIIQINGYTQEEKREIARTHLIPQVRKEHGLKAKQVKFTDEAVDFVIDHYTRESGVRNLNRKLAGICRGVAAKIVNGDFKSIKINPERVNEYLGAPKHEREEFQRIEEPGVAVGLAWTPVGGEILFIETVLSKGSGQLSLTGQLGDVMKESAQIAYTWLRANAADYGIPAVAFKAWDVHIHIPAGAIPKDGPSAGTAMLSAIASAFTQRKARQRQAMTGEITLRGKVMPVGGIKEKVLAASRAGIQEVILCRQNKKDVEEIKPEHLIENLKIRYVERMAELLDLGLEKDVVENPLEVVPQSGKGVGFMQTTAKYG